MGVEKQVHAFFSAVVDKVVRSAEDTKALSGLLCLLIIVKLSGLAEELLSRMHCPCLGGPLVAENSKSKV